MIHRGAGFMSHIPMSDHFIPSPLTLSPAKSFAGYQFTSHLISPAVFETSSVSAAYPEYADKYRIRPGEMVGTISHV
jgi:aconitase B